MANLAIKGHATRGDEVIEILEMLGGNNKYHINITECNLLYTIREGDNAIIATYPNSNISKIYTLEEFLEKFPYKVGDKVIAYVESCLAQFTIQDIRWNYELNIVEYKICSSWCDTSLMQPYKEEAMEEDKGNISDGYHTFNELYEYSPQDVANRLREFLTPKPTYPKTYDECAKIMQVQLEWHLNKDYSSSYETKLDYKIHRLKMLL